MKIFRIVFVFKLIIKPLYVNFDKLLYGQVFLQ